MDFEDLLKIALALASIIQFFLSFIKGRSSEKDYGEVLVKLNLSMGKRKFLAFLFVGLIIYLGYVMVTGYFSILGILIIIYFILSIYDFSKLKIITSKGIGQKSFYSNAYYNFTCWSEVIEWTWSDKKENLLIFKINNNKKIETKDWQVLSLEKNDVHNYFEKYALSSFKEREK